MSQRQRGYNFWLSVQVFGCPYLEFNKVFKWGRSFTAGTRKVMVVRRTTGPHQCLWLSGEFFWLSRAHGATKISNTGPTARIKQGRPTQGDDTIIIINQLSHGDN